MDLLSKAIISIALIIMPMGLFLVLQGPYFHEITSRDSINRLFQDTKNEIFSSQITMYSDYCDSLNITCTSFDDTVSSICEKSREYKNEADSSAAELCSQSNVSCSNIGDARQYFCSNLGAGSDICVQLSSIENSVESLESSCEQMQEYNRTMSDSMEEAYETEYNGFSLAQINSLFENSLSIGIIIFAISVAMIYFASRNWFTVFNSVFFTLLSTGIIILLFWYLGNSMIATALPAEINGNMPRTLTDFIAGMMEYEYYVGSISTATGAIGALGIFILRKTYFKDYDKK